MKMPNQIYLFLEKHFLVTSPAGSGVSGFDKFIDFSENMSPLGNAGSLD